MKTQKIILSLLVIVILLVSAAFSVAADTVVNHQIDGQVVEHIKYYSNNIIESNTEMINQIKVLIFDILFIVGTFILNKIIDNLFSLNEED